MSNLIYLAVYCFALFSFVYANKEADDQTDVSNEEVKPEVLEYAKGSLCNYCKYCEFCGLCDKECPCTPSPGKPNCEMCKYCKYCTLCKACDAVCSPGGFIDTVTAKIVNSLPTYNQDEVDSDLKKMSEWIDKKDEL